jgi:hypothetical protein
MDKYGEILRSLGRIEGRLVGIEKLTDRVRKLESWVAWFKGGWAALLAGCVYVCKRL